ncbi:hypothetical protein ACSVC9_09310 [Clostridium sp. LBM24168]
MTVENITSSLFAYNYFHSSNVIKLTPENKPNNPPLDLSKIDIDTVEISKEAIEKLAAKNRGIIMTPILIPKSPGQFSEDRGNFNTSAPANFPHCAFNGASQDDFVQKGIINQDYVNQFNTILKDSNGDLKTGNNVFVAALNKYAALKSSISASNLPNAETQIQQLENSLEWSVGTSLNKFANDMTQSNTTFVKSPDYSAEKRTLWIMYSDGTKAENIFSDDNSSYTTAVNIVLSAAKLTEKGIDYINNKQYDPQNSEDASKLLSAMNNGTNDKDSSNLSLSTLTGVISTFRNFVAAPNQTVINNADNLAKNAPSSDIAAVYISLKNRIELFPHNAFYDEGI